MKTFRKILGVTGAILLILRKIVELLLVVIVGYPVILAGNIVCKIGNVCESKMIKDIAAAIHYVAIRAINATLTDIPEKWRTDSINRAQKSNEIVIESLCKRIGR